MGSIKVQRIFTAILLVGTFLNSGIGLAAGNSNPGKPKDETQIVGQLTVIGAATINDKRAITGTSVLNNSQIRVACAKGNTAIVNLGRLGRVELNPGAQLVLRFSNGLVTGDLIQGNILVNSPAGVKVSINTPDGVTASDGKDASVLPVRTQRGVRCVPVVASSTASPALGSASLLLLMLGAGGGAIGAVASTGNDDEITAPVSETRIR
jgi:hypothetical protein